MRLVTRKKAPAHGSSRTVVEVSGPEVAYRSIPGEFAKNQLAGLNDCDLVRRTLAGETLAFEILVERYTPMVIGHLYGRVGCESDAEDIAQEVFLTAYRGLASLRASDRVGPWLARIMKSRLIDFYRKSSRSPRMISGEGLTGMEDGPLGRMHDPGPSPGQQASTSQTRQMVMLEISTMKEKYREVLHLRLLGEESTEEIARRLGIKESAVRMRMLRGMRLLRKVLQKHGIGPEITD